MWWETKLWVSKHALGVEHEHHDVLWIILLSWVLAEKKYNMSYIINYTKKLNYMWFNTTCFFKFFLLKIKRSFFLEKQHVFQSKYWLRWKLFNFENTFKFLLLISCIIQKKIIKKLHMIIRNLLIKLKIKKYIYKSIKKWKKSTKISIKWIQTATQKSRFT